MKKLLTILFFVPLIGAAQKKDSLPVIMLVCDTAFYEALVHKGYDTLPDNLGGTTYLNQFKKVKNYNHSAYWQFGYEVREIVDYIQVWDNNGTRMKLLPEYKHIEYLNEDKSPMKKSVIIWQSKNR